MNNVQNSVESTSKTKCQCGCCAGGECKCGSGGCKCSSGACSTTGKGCCCVCHMMGGILIALIGVTVLLGNLEIITPKIVGLVWPSLLILLGLKKALKGRCSCCSKS
jgi:hypothetical protein